jgi:hypothetical protein
MEEFDVTDFDPTRRVEIQGAIGPFQARISYALEAMGDETKLANAVELTPLIDRVDAPRSTGQFGG